MKIGFHKVKWCNFINEQSWFCSDPRYPYRSCGSRSRNGHFVVHENGEKIDAATGTDASAESS